MIEKEFNIEQSDFDKLLNDFINENPHKNNQFKNDENADSSNANLPTIKKATINTENNLPIAYTHHIVTLSLTFSKSLTANGTFRLVCYNDNYFRMCEMEEEIKARKRKNEISFVSSHLWLPGEYNAFCELNGVPMCKVAFCVSENDTIMIDVQKLSKTSHGYYLMRYLENQDPEWNYLQKVSCIGQFRKRIISNLSTHGAIDRLREQNGLKYIYYNSNYIVHGNLQKDTSSVLEFFIKYIKGQGSYMYNDCNDLTETYNHHNGYPDTIADAFPTVNDGIVAFGGLNALLSPGSSYLVHRIINFLKRCNKRTVVLNGSKTEIGQVFETYPALKDFFPLENVIETEPMRAYEIIYMVHDILAEQGLFLSTAVATYLSQHIMEAVDKGLLSKWNEDDVLKFVDNNIVSRLRMRIINQMNTTGEISYDTNVVKLEDVDFSVFNNMSDTFSKSIKELNQMVGLDNLKKEIKKTFNYVRFNAIRRDLGLKSNIQGSHHMIFTGNPGTGKTTVAKMIGKIFYSLGLLSKGDVIVTERSRMVGRYIGETEQNMVALLEEARGNVLFVDEAYTLFEMSDDHKDFGYHALESLLTVLSQKNPDVLIIFAGYKKEIERMLQANQGLGGRFPHHFHFDDYAADELMQIAQNIVDSEDYELDIESKNLLFATIEDAVRQKDEHFSNARWIEQYVRNGIIPAVADRLICKEEELNHDSCRLITLDDINTAYQKYRYIPVVNQHDERNNITPISALPRVGFRIA